MRGARSALLVTVPLLLGCLTAVWMLAEIALVAPRQLLESWQQKNQVDEPLRWRAARDLFAFAAPLKPMDADIRLEQARVDVWGTSLADVAPDEAARLRRQAITTVESALRERPTWGAAWAQLSMLYLQARKPITDTMAAYRQGMHYAWTEGANFQQLLYVGLLLWDFLPADDQQALIQMVDFMLPPHPRQVIDVAVLLRKEAWLSPRLTSTVQRAYLAEQLRKRRGTRSDDR